jgi:hypothetical protein
VESEVRFDLNRSPWRMHFGYCFAYDNCFWYLIVVYVCVIMEKLELSLLDRSVDSIFSLWKVRSVINYNPEKLYLVDWIVCCLVDSLCLLGYIRYYCYVITGSCRFPVVGSYRLSSVGYHRLPIVGSDRS